METFESKEDFRIGVSFEGFCGWQGGIDFCMTLLRVLGYRRLYRERRVNIYCFIPVICSIKEKSDFIEKCILGFHIKRELRNGKVIFYNKASLPDLTEKYKIDIIFPVYSWMNFSNTLAIGYIADLQHRYLKNFFSPKVIKMRDEKYKKILNSFKYIIVNSQHVKNSLERNYSPYPAKVFVLPCLPIASKWHIERKNNIHHMQKKYNIPKRYFLISNQFWMHKNHLLAFHAFEKVYQAGYKDVFLVCTGKMEDYRSKTYIERMLQEVEKLECKNNILFLGLIPKRDQLCIMRNSIAVIQPTQFEGGPGGGSVYDAIAMQIPCIISDIEINKELPKSRRIRYFKADSPEKLNQKMIEMINNPYKKASNTVLMKKRNRNLSEFAKELYFIINTVINGEIMNE